MKTLKIQFLLILCILFICSIGWSQTEKGSSVLGLNIGYSLTGAVISDVNNNINSDDVNVTVTPALNLSYDYALSDRFSLGLYAGTQIFTTKIDGYSFLNNNEEVIEDVSGNAMRWAIGLRPLFHYGNTDKLDMYSGLRLGYIAWSANTNSSDPALDLGTSFGVGRPSISIIAFGMRYYFTDTIGAGFEVATGAPHVASASVNMRFGGSSSSASMKGDDTNAKSSKDDRRKSSKGKKRR